MKHGDMLAAAVALTIVAAGCEKKAKGGAEFTGDCATVKAHVEGAAPEHAQIVELKCKEKMLRQPDVNCITKTTDPKEIKFCLDSAEKWRKANL